MKKIITLILALLLTNFSFAQKLHKIAPKIIVIGLGEKNPFFDESQFPDLNFFYTPTLKVDYGNDKNTVFDTISRTNLKYKLKDITYSGTPDYILAISKKDNPINHFLLFDRNGICYTYGFNLSEKEELTEQECENKHLLVENLQKLVKKKKQAKKARKPFNLEKPKSIIGNQLDNFPLQNPKGESLELNSLLGQTACMIVFFNLPADVDIRPISKEDKKLLERKEVKQAKDRVEIGEKSTKILIDLEEQFFKLKIRN